MPHTSFVIACKDCFEKIDAAMLRVFLQREDDVEIICVDDASNNKTVELLRQYALFDRRISLIENKKEIGLLKCCELGIKAAKSPYTMLLNATWHFLLAEDYSKRLLALASESAADVVLSPVVLVDAIRFFAYQIGIFPPEVVQKNIGATVFRAADVQNGFYFNFNLSPYFKLFRTDFLKSLDFSLKSEPFLLNALFSAKRVAFETDFMCYRQVKASELFEPEVFLEQAQICEVMKKTDVWDTQKTYFVMHKYEKLWQSLQLAPNEQKKQIFEKIKQEFEAEDFSQYDFNILRKCQLYWSLKSAVNLSFDELIAKSGGDDE